jgi:hypothetical protein
MAATFWFSQPLQFFDRLLTHSYRCSSSLDPVLANPLRRPLSLFSFDRLLDGPSRLPPVILRWTLRTRMISKNRSIRRGKE